MIIYDQSFNQGDLIDAINESKDGWQFGTNVRTSKTGWFPAQYVDRLFPTPETRYIGGLTETILIYYLAIKK